jgi:hypothetical protein
MTYKHQFKRLFAAVIELPFCYFLNKFFLFQIFFKVFDRFDVVILKNFKNKKYILF